MLKFLQSQKQIHLHPILRKISLDLESMFTSRLAILTVTTYSFTFSWGQLRMQHISVQGTISDTGDSTGCKSRHDPALVELRVIRSSHHKRKIRAAAPYTSTEPTCCPWAATPAPSAIRAKRYLTDQSWVRA